MDAVILVLCIALTLVTVVALISGGLKLKQSVKDFNAETLKETLPKPNILLVQQNEGKVRIAYLTEEAAEEAAVAAAPAAEPSSPAPDEESDSASEEELQDGVLIPKAERLTYEERYARLPEENRKLLDEFVAYIEGKEDCETCIRTSALLCRYKKSQVAKVSIRRDFAILSFPIANPELGRLVREEKIKSVKMQPATVKLADENDLALAKQTADIALDYLKGEEEYKLEKRKEARREAARRKREEGEES